jgi:hypothetical protein
VRLLGFLGVEATGVKLTQSSIKQGGKDLRTHIENYQELERAFQGSEHLEELYNYDN